MKRTWRLNVRFLTNCFAELSSPPRFCTVDNHAQTACDRIFRKRSKSRRGNSRRFNIRFFSILPCPSLCSTFTTASLQFEVRYAHLQQRLQPFHAFILPKVSLDQHSPAKPLSRESSLNDAGSTAFLSLQVQRTRPGPSPPRTKTPSTTSCQRFRYFFRSSFPL